MMDARRNSKLQHRIYSHPYFEAAARDLQSRATLFWICNPTPPSQSAAGFIICWVSRITNPRAILRWIANPALPPNKRCIQSTGDDSTPHYSVRHRAALFTVQRPSKWRLIPMLNEIASSGRSSIQQLNHPLLQQYPVPDPVV